MKIDRKGALSAPTPRLRVGPIASHIGSFARFLTDQGYAPHSVESKCFLVADLSRWLKRRGLPLAQVDEGKLKQYHAHHRRSIRRGDLATSQKLPAVYLGATTVTDVCEIMLRDIAGTPITDIPTAFTIAVALRKAGARLVGVEIEELGCDVKPVRTEAGAIVQVIVIYDKNSAGYSSILSERMEEVLRVAAAECDCPRGCRDGCQECLLSFDTRFRTADIKRDRALQLLSSAWLDSLSLPESFRVFGDSSRLERHNLITAINLEVERKAAGLDIYVCGAIADADFAAPPLRPLLYRWASRGLKVRLVLDDREFRASSEDVRNALYVLANVPGIELWATPSARRPKGYALVARVRRPSAHIAWATRSPSTGVPGDLWGAQGDEELIVGPDSEREATWTRIETDSLARGAVARHGTTLLRVTADLNGSTRQFGALFWKLASAAYPGLAQRLGDKASVLVEVTYSDRYLKAPLPALLLLRTLAALKDSVGDRWCLGTIAIATTPCEPNNLHHRTGRISDNWQESAVRDAVITEAFEGALAVRLTLTTRRRQEVPHARTLTLGFRRPGISSGIDLVRIWLDQGFGYWWSQEPSRGLASNTDFNFSAKVAQQAIHLSQVEISVRGQEYPTFIVAAMDA